MQRENDTKYTMSNISFQASDLCCPFPYEAGGTNGFAQIYLPRQHKIREYREDLQKFLTNRQTKTLMPSGRVFRGITTKGDLL
jgi:hypothetical protein